MNPVCYFDCNLSDLNINKQELYLLMGYGNHIPNDEILHSIDQMINELSGTCKPRCGYAIHTGEITGREHIKIQDTTLKPGRIITTAMRNADYYALFTATAGSSFDNWFDHLKQKDDIVKTFIADALGSVIAESAVSWLMRQLEEEANREGMLISNNYSPGYCDWLLIDQQKLFSLLPPNISGIQLTDSSLMLPIKSVSGIVAIGKNVKKRPYGCDICTMTTCIKNKKKVSTSKS